MRGRHLSVEISPKIKLPIYIVSSINAVIFVMNLGIITNNFKIDWLDFKAKAGMISENTRRLDELNVDVLVKTYSNSLERCAKRLNATTKAG